MSLVLTGVKSDLYSRTNKTVASYTSTTTAVSGTNTFVVAASLDGTTIAAATFIGATNAIWVSNNSGVSYSLRQSTAGGTSSIACSDDGTKIYVGDTLFYYSYDSGATFQNISFANADDGLACSSSGTIIYGVTQSINVHRSIDSGLSFNTTAVAGLMRGVCCSSDGTKVFAASSVGLYYSSDTGVSYTLISSITSIGLLEIACNSDASVVVYAAGTILYVSTDTGLTFIPRLSSSAGVGIANCSADGKIISIAYENATIYISNDYGVNWINTGSPCVDGGQTIKSSKLVYSVGDGSVGVASFSFNPITSIGTNVSVASSTNPGFGVVNLQQCTISTAAAATTTTASSFRIEGPPVAGTNHTITNKYALEVLSGPSVFNGLVSLSGPIYRTPRIIIVATTLTADLGSSFIVVTSGTFTLTLPGIQTSATNGLEFFIANAGSGTVTLSVANTGTEKFNGAAITSISMSQHDRTHIIAFTNTATSVYKWYNF
jgi:hypothetical protein